jgi:outer membrane protein assembly factor BamE (lipoprotein component of BamABCDE complex)
LTWRCSQRPLDLDLAMEVLPMRFDSSLSSAILIALLAGCASSNNAGSQGPSTADLAKLTTGKTTTDEVKTLLGPPLRVTRFDRMDRNVWEYRRYHDPMDEHHIAVQFSSDGIVREVLVLKDYNREPCGP